MSEPFLSDEEVERRQKAASDVFRAGAGKEFVSYLLDDLGFYDIPETEGQMILHNFGLVFLKRYFGATIDNREHRSFVTEAIIGAWKPPKEQS